MFDDLLAGTRRLADELLRPQAEQVDCSGVPRSHLDALADLGLFGLHAPRAAGGVDAPPWVAREVAEVLAAADASTWFVFTQHHTPVRTVRRSPSLSLREQWLPALAAGRVIAGTAFTHLRRPGPAPLTATPVAGGDWRVDGTIAWLTSWGLADVFLVGAQHRDDEVVWLLPDLREGPAVEVRPLRLAAMQGTATVGVRLDGLAVPADRLVLRESLADWRAADAARTVDVNPALFGVVAEALRRLDEAGAAAAAVSLGAERDRLRAAAYRLADTAGDGRLEERTAVRAAAHELALRVTAALVAAGGGRAMLGDQPAQRLAREALFLLVQGQTAPVRRATLARLSGSGDAPGGA